MPGETRLQLRRLLSRLGFERDWYLIVLGALIGTATGLGAVGFAWALHTVEHLSRQAPVRLGERWGLGPWSLALLPILPMLGALLTGLVVHLFASDARGHGVPQVMEALIRRAGRIPLRVGLVKVAASIFTVGSGGSAGAEGPIIQIGATAGSVAGVRLRVSREHMGTLVGCGAAAGMAAIFNAPIAGVFFVLEILLRDFSVRTFTPIVVSSVFATATAQAALGRNEAIFASQMQAHDYTYSLAELPGYIVLGVVCGLLAVGYSRLLHAAEDRFAAIRIHPVLRPVLGAAMLGLLGVGFVVAFTALAPEHLAARGIALHGQTPAFFANGYDTIRTLLDPGVYAGLAADAAEPGGPDRETVTAAAGMILLLVALTLCKVVGTVFTLGSGGSGGVFAPSLFMGATAGGAYGAALDAAGLMPAGGSPASYALVGMAAVVAGAMHAPLTAILILFELTRDVYVLLPVMLAAVLATVTAQLADRDSIYTASLRRKGFRIGGGRDLSVLRRVPLSSVRLTPLPPEPVYPSDPLSKLVALHAYYDVPDFVVVDESGAYVGMVTGRDMRTALIDREAVPLLLVAELLRTDLPTLSPTETLDSAVEKFSGKGADLATLALLDDSDPSGDGRPRPIGLISRSAVMQHYHRALDES